MNNFRLSWWLLSCILLACMPFTHIKAFDIQWGIPGYYDPFDPCAGPQTPGGTFLYDITYLPAPDGWYFDALEWQFSGENIYTKDGVQFRPPEDRWIFDYGGQLSGTLFIDVYYAYDKHTGDVCRHGAHLSASYLPSPNDPSTLDWVQVFVASYDKNGVPGGTPLVDPFYNDGTDGGPFYFSNLDNPSGFYEGFNNDLLIFGDTPGAPHWEEDAFSVSLELFLFLSYKDPLDDRHLYICDGISWGYFGVCVPAPSAASASSIFVLIVAFAITRSHFRKRNAQ
jgi:hypothetical protein